LTLLSGQPKTNIVRSIVHVLLKQIVSSKSPRRNAYGETKRVRDETLTGKQKPAGLSTNTHSRRVKFFSRSIHAVQAKRANELGNKVRTIETQGLTQEGLGTIERKLCIQPESPLRTLQHAPQFQVWVKKTDGPISKSLCEGLWHEIN
jgi:hypothetical protein